jgi:probable rRNA maturation factor
MRAHATSAAMIDVEIFDATGAPGLPPPAEVRRLCTLAAGRRGVHDGHVAVEIVDSSRIAQLNGEHRGKSTPTDVLSFPIDGVSVRGDTVAGGGGVPVELGDIVICPEHTADVPEAVVHGMLHLLGMDHETDSGEMLALQAEILAAER